MDILFLLIGLVVGAALGFFIKKATTNSLSTAGVPPDYEQLKTDKARLEGRITDAEIAFRKQDTDLKEERNRADNWSKEATKWKSDFENLQVRLTEQKEEINDLQQKFTDQFKAIANDILKQNSKEFSEHNQKSIGDILNPLKEKILTFEKKVEETYDKESKERHSLKDEVKRLAELNIKMSEEANNLTLALKGDAKQQGNWGEMVLERILESSGLIKEEEYKLQYSLENEDGQRVQPDVVIMLPDEKHLIVDSKVSLVAYERFTSSSDEDQRKIHQKDHLISIKTHIQGLSNKYYQSIPGLNSPDFVLLFIPIESSFSLAVQADQDLFNYAWDRKVVIVSPSTLLASLKTVASIWKQERQNKNAVEIAKQSGALYDKFVGFIEDLKKVGVNISKSTEAYEEAMKKLSTGSGNLIGRAERIKKLGAKAEKSLDRTLVEEENLLAEPEE